MENKMQENMNTLKELAKDWGCTIAEAAHGMLCDFYEAAGFRGEQLEEEFNAMSDKEIIELYCNL